MIESYPFPKRQILESSKLREFADENGRKLSERVGNNVGKGEIARYEQFLLFPQCFQTTCFADTYKPGFVWERFKSIPFGWLRIKSLTTSNKWDGHVLIFIFIYFVLFVHMSLKVPIAAI